MHREKIKPMHVSYIKHSSFMVELEKSILIFDYYKGNIPAINPNKKLFVFSSHAHHDHFSFDVFKCFAEHPQVQYILSDDIKDVFSNEHEYEKILFMAPHQTLQLDGLTIETLKSTDQGVAFIIEIEGSLIYHAGDLHWWHWNASSADENRQMEINYKQEIERLKDRHFDLAFLVLDPRQKNAFYWGFDYFMKHVQVDRVYPMHCWGKFSVVEQLLNIPESLEYREKIVQYLPKK